jgi:hypothetical protein
MVLLVHGGPVRSQSRPSGPWSPIILTAKRPASAGPPLWLAIGLVCLASLLLEVAYTRIISYKLWYYYTYLVIGLSLLGIGTGGILVSIAAPVRRASTRTVVAVAGLAGGILVGVGYLALARIPINTLEIWDYGTRGSIENLAALGVMCLALFAPFIAVGVVISTILGRAGERVGRLYFADLMGAAIGCIIAIPLIAWLSPPQVVALSGLVLAVIGVAWLPVRAGAGSLAGLAIGTVASLVLAAGVLDEDRTPEINVEYMKLSGAEALASDWGPVFRVDVLDFGQGRTSMLLSHDGTYGSGIWAWDGEVDSLDRYDTDSRAIPFDVLGRPPERELIIGSAGGQEILASLHRDATSIDAVELNPVTVDLLDDEFAEYAGQLADRPEVNLVQGDGRTYLARSDEDYDLIWFVAPDSYAANNAASSGAFVLSESYLYTQNMIAETLEHLTDDGIMAVQFGELSFETSPNRTSRFVVTARAALEQLGVDDPTAHLLVASERNETADLSTIIVSASPFTRTQIDGFLDGLGDIEPAQTAVHAPGESFGDHIVSRIARGSDDEVDEIVESAPQEIDVITDDAPFFWHFSSFGDVLGDLTEPLSVFDPEEAVGERVMLLLLGIAVLMAAGFLLLPFVFVRRDWKALPAKGISAVYFACLGMGFMLFEITMIQRLVRFLGYPTYSLTVTLASILVFTGLGALLSKRFEAKPTTALPVTLALLAVLAVFYQFGLDVVTDSLQSSGLGVRIAVAILVLAPLGLCLGMFMPLGLQVVGGAGERGEQYVAWSWAVNGFFSVIGSVLTTILAMELGFRLVQFLALCLYAVAVVSFVRMRRAIATPDAPTPELPEVLSAERTETMTVGTGMGHRG